MYIILVMYIVYLIRKSGSIAHAAVCRVQTPTETCGRRRHDVREATQARVIMIPRSRACAIYVYHVQQSQEIHAYAKGYPLSQSSHVRGFDDD